MLAKLQKICYNKIEQILINKNKMKISTTRLMAKLLVSFGMLIIFAYVAFAFNFDKLDQMIETNSFKWSELSEDLTEIQILETEAKTQYEEIKQERIETELQMRDLHNSNETLRGLKAKKDFQQ